MTARIDFRKAAPDAVQPLVSLRNYLNDCGLDLKLRLLIEVRVSQLNGCAYCVDTHVREARNAGETQRRLDCLVVWRDVDFFNARERAALAWAETLTRLTTEHADDETYHAVRAQFSDKELVDLTFAIAGMNAWNRIGVGFRVQPKAGA